MPKKLAVFYTLWLIIGMATACVADDNQVTSKTKMESNNIKLSLKLSLDGTAYHIGEPIIAKIILTNISTDNVTIKKRMIPGFLPDSPETEPELYHDIAFIITSPSRKVVPYAGRLKVDALDSSSFITLKPNEFFEVSWDIEELHSFSYSQEYGKYNVYVIYYNAFKPNVFSDVWKGSLESNIITFEILAKE